MQNTDTLAWDDGFHDRHGMMAFMIGNGQRYPEKAWSVTSHES